MLFFLFNCAFIGYLASPSCLLDVPVLLLCAARELNLHKFNCVGVGFDSQEDWSRFSFLLFLVTCHVGCYCSWPKPIWPQCLLVVCVGCVCGSVCRSVSVGVCAELCVYVVPAGSWLSGALCQLVALSRMTQRANKELDCALSWPTRSTQVWAHLSAI